MKANFVFLLSWTVSADNFLRGNDLPHDEKRRYLGNAAPPDHAESVLATLNIDDNGGSMEFYEYKDTIYVAVTANNDETMKNVNGLGPEVSGNPVAIFQHFAPPDKSIPEALLGAKKRVDEKIRNEENNHIEYAQIPDAPDGDGEEDGEEVGEEEDHEDDRKLKEFQEALIHPPEQRELCADLNFPYGSEDWWYENFCRPLSVKIYQNPCICYTYRTGNDNQYAYHTNVHFYSYAVSGGVWMLIQNLDDGQWVHTPFQLFVQQGYVGYLTAYGPSQARRAVVVAPDSVYHWSFFGTSNLPCVYCQDNYLSPPSCPYCQNTNFEKPY